MKIKRLPEDMQVLLMQMSEESGHRIWQDETTSAVDRFLDVDLSVVRVPLEAFPEVDIEDIDVERPIAPYLEVGPMDFPPVVVAHGRFMDGRHRVLAARMRLQTVYLIRTIDASRVIRPAYAKRWNLGSIRMEFIENLQETGSTRDSLEDAERLFLKYGLPEAVTLMVMADDWKTRAVWPDGFPWTFEGFAWGYSGEGPRGLETFFKMIGMPIDYATIVKWPLPTEIWKKGRSGPLEWSPRPPTRRFVLGVDFGKDWE